MTAPLYLIGYRGTGKSTVARLVAEKLGWDWCDADAELEARFGTTIREIFANAGETDFRLKETQVLRDLSQRQDCVIATGGGVVLRPENRAILKEGLVVWLTAPAEVLWRRLQEDQATADRRPNLAQGGLAEVVDLLQRREPFYRECANRIVDAARSAPGQIAGEIASWLRERPAQ